MDIQNILDTFQHDKNFIYTYSHPKLEELIKSLSQVYKLDEKKYYDINNEIQKKCAIEDWLDLIKLITSYSYITLSCLGKALKHNNIDLYKYAYDYTDGYCQIMDDYHYTLVRKCIKYDREELFMEYTEGDSEYREQFLDYTIEYGSLKYFNLIANESDIYMDFKELKQIAIDNKQYHMLDVIQEYELKKVRLKYVKLKSELF